MSKLPESNVKAMFFAQYQFSHVCFDGISNSVWTMGVDIIKGYFVNNGDKGKIFVKDTTPLNLRPISKISVEDAKELIKIMKMEHLSEVITPSVIIAMLVDYTSLTGKISVWLGINDFLRSKGYAVPFMDYSVDDLISFGWINLK